MAKNVSQKTGLTYLREIFERMKVEGASAAELLGVAREISTEERHRRRNRKPKAKKRVKRRFEGLSILAQLGSRVTSPKPSGGS